MNEEDIAEEKEINEFVDILLVEIGLATQKSTKLRESKKLINITLPLRPSVIALLTNRLSDSMIPLPKEEKQKILSEGLGIFLSDMVDAGIIHTAKKLSISALLDKAKKKE